MHKRLVPIIVLTGVLFITALVGYLIPQTSDEPPVRVLLENKGGKVIFTHNAHLDMQNRDCGVCHHTSGSNPTPPPCSRCHVAKFDENFIHSHQDTFEETQCSTCHHPKADTDRFSHEKHMDDYAADDCTACHHDESIESDPQACANCHEKNGDKEMPNLKDATHTRCANCHEDMYAEGRKGCANCHTREFGTTSTGEYQPCTSCHDESAEELIPTTMKAFHGQCMACHEKRNAGPFGDDACGRCHMK